MRMLTPKHEAPEPPTRMTSYKFDASGQFHRHPGQWRNLGAGHGRFGHGALEQAGRDLHRADSAQFLDLSSDLKVGPEEFMVDKDSGRASIDTSVVLGHKMAGRDFDQHLGPVLLGIGIVIAPLT